MMNTRELEKIAEGLIGIPFVACGRDLETGIDCLGLVIAFFCRVGIALPDPLSWDTKEVAESNFSSMFNKVIGEPKDLDVARSLDRHLGIVIGRRILHTAENTGVVSIPIRCARVQEYYRLRDEK